MEGAPAGVTTGGARLQYVGVLKDGLEDFLTTICLDMEAFQQGRGSYVCVIIELNSITQPGLADICERWQEPLAHAFEELAPGGAFCYHTRVAVVDHVHQGGKKQQAPYLRQLILTLGTSRRVRAAPAGGAAGRAASQQEVEAQREEGLLRAVLQWALEMLGPVYGASLTQLIRRTLECLAHGVLPSIDLSKQHGYMPFVYIGSAQQRARWLVQRAQFSCPSTEVSEEIARLSDAMFGRLLNVNVGVSVFEAPIDLRQWADLLEQLGLPAHPRDDFHRSPSLGRGGMVGLLVTDMHREKQGSGASARALTHGMQSADCWLPLVYQLHTGYLGHEDASWSARLVVWSGTRRRLPSVQCMLHTRLAKLPDSWEEALDNVVPIPPGNKTLLYGERHLTTLLSNTGEPEQGAIGMGGLAGDGGVTNPGINPPAAPQPGAAGPPMHPPFAAAPAPAAAAAVAEAHGAPGPAEGGQLAPEDPPMRDTEPAAVRARRPPGMAAMVVCSKNVHMAMLGQVVAAKLLKLGGVPGRVPRITPREPKGPGTGVIYCVLVDGKYQLRALFKGAIAAIRMLAGGIGWCQPFLATELGTLSLLLPLRKVYIIERGLAAGYLAPWEAKERFAKVEFDRDRGGTFTVVAVELELSEEECKHLIYRGKRCPVPKADAPRLWMVAEDVRFLLCSGENVDIEHLPMLNHQDPATQLCCQRILEAAKTARYPDRGVAPIGQCFAVESLLCEAARAPFPYQFESMPRAAEYDANSHLTKLQQVVERFTAHHTARIAPVEAALIAAGLQRGPFPQLANPALLMMADRLKHFCEKTHGKRSSDEQMLVGQAIPAQELPDGYMEAQDFGTLFSPTLGDKNFMRHLLNQCVYVEEVKMSQQEGKAICELRGVLAFRHGGKHNMVKIRMLAQSGKRFKLWPAFVPAMQASALQPRGVLQMAAEQAQRFTRVSQANATAAFSSSLELVDQDGNPTEHSLAFLGGLELGEDGIEGLRRELAATGRLYSPRVLEEARSQQLAWRLTAPPGTRVIVVNPFLGVAIGEGVVEKAPFSYFSQRLMDTWRKCIRVVVDNIYGGFADPFMPGIGSRAWFGISDAWLMRYPPGQSPEELAEAEEDEVAEEMELAEELEVQQQEEQQEEQQVLTQVQTEQQQQQQEQVQPEPQRQQQPPAATGPSSEVSTGQAQQSPLQLQEQPRLVAVNPRLDAAWLYYQLEAEEWSLQSGQVSTDQAQQTPPQLQQQQQQPHVQPQPLQQQGQQEPQQLVQPEPQQQQQQPPSVATTVVVDAGSSSVAAALAAGDLGALPAALAAEEAAARATLQAMAQLAQEDAAVGLLLSTAAQDTPAQPGLASPPAAVAALLPRGHAPDQPPLSPAALIPPEWSGEWSPSSSALPPLPPLPSLPGWQHPLGLGGQSSPSGPLRQPALQARAAVAAASTAAPPVRYVIDELDPVLLDMVLPDVE
ncbi:hypothetical protein N2152v2_000055 [Parachlorella kessleri]